MDHWLRECVAASLFGKMNGHDLNDAVGLD